MRQCVRAHVRVCVCISQTSTSVMQTSEADSIQNKTIDKKNSTNDGLYTQVRVWVCTYGQYIVRRIYFRLWPQRYTPQRTEVTRRELKKKTTTFSHIHTADFSFPPDTSALFLRLWFFSVCCMTLYFFSFSSSVPSLHLYSQTKDFASNQLRSIVCEIKKKKEQMWLNKLQISRTNHTKQHSYDLFFLSLHSSTIAYSCNWKKNTNNLHGFPCFRSFCTFDLAALCYRPFF